MTPAAHQAWAAALRDDAAPAPPGLRSWNDSDVAQRWNVHRHNVQAGLGTSLGEAFPVLHEVVGEAAFSVLARDFLAMAPPTSPVLSEWGEALPAFLSTYPPAADWPWLADLALLEHLRVRCHHAADAPPLESEVIARHLATPATLPAARLGWHPAAAVWHSRWAVASVWAAHHGQGTLAGVDLGQAEAALVVREDAPDGGAVLVLPVSPALGEVLATLARGGTLGDAAAQASTPNLLTEALALLLRHGVITHWHTPEEPGP